MQILFCLHPGNVKFITEIVLNFGPLKFITIDEVTRDSMIQAKNDYKNQNQHKNKQLIFIINFDFIVGQILLRHLLFLVVLFHSAIKNINTINHEAKNSQNKNLL